MLTTTRAASTLPAPSRAGHAVLALVVLLATAWLDRPLAAQAAGGGVLTLDVSADANDPHKEEIDLLSWSWGTAATTTGHSATTRPPPGPGSLTLVRAIDRSSPLLMQALTNNEIIERATLILRPARRGDRPVTITLHDVRIASIQPSGASGDGRPTEHITLNFTRVQ
jgi:type VI secretion system secreted protein Hcp